MFNEFKYKDLVVNRIPKLQNFTQSLEECEKLKSKLISLKTLKIKPVFSKVKQLISKNAFSQYRVSPSNNDSLNCFGVLNPYLTETDKIRNLCKGDYGFDKNYLTLCEKKIDFKNNYTSEQTFPSDQNNSYIVPLIIVIAIVVVIVIVALVIYMVKKKYFPSNRQVVAEDGVNGQQASQVYIL